MIVKSLKLNQFRNYESLQLSFDKGTNLFYGNNAQGKTNILEAVYLCGTTVDHIFSEDHINLTFFQSQDTGLIIRDDFHGDGFDGRLFAPVCL